MLIERRSVTQKWKAESQRGTEKCMRNVRASNATCTRALCESECPLRTLHQCRSMVDAGQNFLPVSLQLIVSSLPSALHSVLSHFVIRRYKYTAEQINKENMMSSSYMMMMFCRTVAVNGSSVRYCLLRFQRQHPLINCAKLFGYECKDIYLLGNYYYNKSVSRGIRWSIGSKFYL